MMDAVKIDKATDAILERVEYITVSVIQNDAHSATKEAEEIKALCDVIIKEARNG